MSAIEATPDVVGNAQRQTRALAAVGVLGFCLDAGVTYALARAFGFNPVFARLPAIALAMFATFALTRPLGGAGSRPPLFDAVLRDGLISGALNWMAYALTLWVVVDPLGLPVRLEALPIFIAFGTGVARFATSFASKLPQMRT